MIATMRHDSFDLTPLAPEERCTPLSVASHTLYEKTRPDRLPGPGGVLDLTNACYEQITAKTCRISSAEFVKTPYQVKLEGVVHLGYRAIFIGGIRDPILIAQIDDFLERVRNYTQNLFPDLDKSDGCRLIYHVYGKDGVMGPFETTQAPAHEIAVLGEVVAPTQELSHTIANNARASILHFSYPGQMATTGNFASPLSPHEQEAGAVFKFSVYHLVDLQAGEEMSLFPIRIYSLKSDKPPFPLPNLDETTRRELETGALAPLCRLISSSPQQYRIHTHELYNIGGDSKAKANSFCQFHSVHRHPFRTGEVKSCCTNYQIQKFWSFRVDARCHVRHRSRVSSRQKGGYSHKRNH